MLNVTLTSEQFELLSDPLKAEYKLDVTGKYNLDLQPDVFITDKDPKGLMSALEAEREESKRVRAIADAFELKAKETEVAGLKTVEEVKVHMAGELLKLQDQRRQDLEQQAAELQKQREATAKQQADAKALEVATTLFGTKAALMLPHVRAQVVGKLDSAGQPIVEIVDPSTGNASIDQNFDNFSKGLSTNPLYSDMVVVSNASGGSANGGNPSKGTNSDGTPLKFNDYKPTELVALRKSDPDLFQQLLKQKQA